MSAHTIKETKDVISFGLLASKVLGDDLADGKMSVMELFGLLKLRGPAMEAISGANQIPAELLDLDSAEAAEIIAMIREAVGSHVTSDDAKGIADDSFSAVKAILSLQARIRKVNPPKAQPVA